MAYRETAHTIARKANTRQRLLKAATTLVRDGGFAAASAVAVAAKSGVASGSIYRHFPNKSELVAEVFRFATEHEIKAAVDAASKQAAANAKLTAVIETFALRAFSSNKLAYALIAEPVDPRVEQERLRYRLAWAEIYEDILAQGIRDGEFVAQDAGLSAAALVGMLAESLVGPLSPIQNNDDTDQSLISDDEQRQLILALSLLALRAVGFEQSRGK